MCRSRRNWGHKLMLQATYLFVSIIMLQLTYAAPENKRHPYQLDFQCDDAIPTTSAMYISKCNADWDWGCILFSLF